ncbi:MAG: CRISPR system precrRNA processing endoribonuclease RAMP protein Cas6 [Bacteroidetes bacterium]|nr:CRISPR system precrRNA processing endoribonuclease RAMP protein Cas6 [Bacteroidota bacterium]MCL6102432.1 CRISPR system precrRNA processing endoribonuclease RAMP protein Cas6 [Bacteroidota bacterium]
MVNLSFIESITFVRVRIIFEALEPIVLPVYKGSAFRGCFGETFRNEVCTHRRVLCENCRERFECPFSLLFNSYVQEEHPHQRKYSKSPHPYIIDPLPGDKTEFAIGDTFGFDLTLIGRVIDHLPLLTRTFDRMGDRGIGKGRGRFRPVDLQVLSSDLEYIPLHRYAPPQRLGISSIDVKQIENLVVLQLDNPLRLRENGDLLRTAPEFLFFAGRLAYRLGLIAHFHCGTPWPEPELLALDLPKSVRIKESKVQIADWRRYSGTQDTKMNFDGLTGQITYEGEGLNDWMPLLTLGSFLHAGSTATFGLGKYSIISK